MTVRQYLIAQFNSKHDIEADAQFRQLVEEVGELAEAMNREDEDARAEELADIVFVARSIAEIHDINLTNEVNTVIEQNLQKDGATDGAKVTKSGYQDD